MNLLQIVQRIKRESGIARLPTGADPVSLAAANGMTVRLIDWAIEAWLEIQRMPRNWRWMLQRRTGTLVAAKMSYTIDELLGAAPGATSHGRFRPDSRDPNGYRMVGQDGAASWTLRQRDYSVFAPQFLVGTHMAGPPQFWAVAPDGKLLIGPTPDKSYSLIFEHFEGLQTLAADDDEPRMPDAFHMAIVWRALNTYGAHAAAPEVVARSAASYAAIERDLIRDQGEPLTLAAAPL